MASISDLVGQKFGRLTVLELAYTNGRSYWKCECDCGNSAIVQGKQMSSGKTRSCGCLQDETRRALSGEKHPNWRGNKVKYRTLHTRMYPLVHTDGVCEICLKKKKLDLANKSGKYLHKITDWTWLCRRCHRRIDTGWTFKKTHWMKTCKGCGINKKVDKDNFYFRNNGNSVGKCKPCCIAKVKEQYK